ncbi:MAG: tRNA (adenosine(37)-N6)-threonylcarbamoyltransferase complex ATPase subunit type 1 TsaE [Steroidobacteraceae bacterium]
MREFLNSAADTEALGARLARARPDAHASLAVLYLCGDLGAGKTTLAQGFLRACGVTGPVRSPTYSLLQLYPLEGQTVVHLDLYRLRAPEEVEHLGLEEWALPGCVWLIEWPQRAEGALPRPDVTVALRVPGAGHEADITYGTAAGEAWWARAARKSS